MAFNLASLSAACAQNASACLSCGPAVASAADATPGALSAFAALGRVNATVVDACVLALLDPYFATLPLLYNVLACPGVGSVFHALGQGAADTAFGPAGAPQQAPQPPALAPPPPQGAAQSAPGGSRSSVALEGIIIPMLLSMALTGVGLGVCLRRAERRAPAVSA